MFANKVVIVTGGSGGIGAATAECFAKESANIAIVGRNLAKLQDVAKNCEKLGAKVLIIKADVSIENEAKTIVKNTIDRFGKLDVLVNNAAIMNKPVTLLDDNILTVYDQVLNTNLRSIIHLTHLAVPYLKKTKGNIVNISSVLAIKANVAGGGPYCVSKAALDHFTRSSAIELAPFGIRVNSINPGPVETDMVHQEIMDGKDFTKLTTLGRLSDAPEIGDLILYVTSDKARSITGSCYVIDNGFLLI